MGPGEGGHIKAIELVVPDVKESASKEIEVTGVRCKSGGVGGTGRGGRALGLGPLPSVGLWAIRHQLIVPSATPPRAVWVSNDSPDSTSQWHRTVTSKEVQPTIIFVSFSMSTIRLPKFQLSI
jgi:hypothetical protein